MNHERELTHAANTSANDIAQDIAPGRSSRTGGLVGPTGTLMSGLLMRKRDGNNVADNADAAVGAASTSSGSGLPDDVRSRFEGSLGTDLSDVRVHTGAASAEAASSVGAKAYTLGNDIHFNAGQYDPGSQGGQHLLAHEVAHTVQQRGSTPTRQNKLEVSSPGDSAEVEADRAADAMVSGGQASVSGASTGVLRRDTEVSFEEDYANPSSQMRADGDRAVKAQRQAAPTQSKGASVSADLSQADVYINRIEQARGPLGQLKGREDAINGESRTVKEQAAYVPRGEGARRIAANTAVAATLNSFKASASRQSFQHALFAPQYSALQEDFARLKASVDIIKSQNLKVVGDEAKSDVEAAKKANPLLAIAISDLKASITDLSNTAGNAEAGLAAVAEKAGSTFDHLGTATDEMKLPLPKLKDTDEQAKANAGVAKVNADLESAKTMISTIKTVVEAAVSVATGGLGAAAIPQVDKILTKMGDTANEAMEKFNAKGVAAPAKAGAGAVQSDLEGKLASWVTNYNSRIASANGKVDALNAEISEKQAKIATDKVGNLQSQLMKEIGRFALLMKQVAEKKAAVTEAAKKVQEQAKKDGKNGTNIGAAAQAMASVSTFLVQADSAEAIGKKEKEQGDKAKGDMKSVAGDYIIQRTPSAFGGPAGLAETAASGNNVNYYECKVAGDADSRGEDLSGYDVQEYTVRFTINEDDKNDRSRVMADSTDPKLENIAKWKGEAKGFEGKLAEALGMAPSKMP